MYSFIYIESENWTDDEGCNHRLYTVGHYNPAGRFIPESDHDNAEEAAARVHYLNGGK